MPAMTPRVAMIVLRGNATFRDRRTRYRAGLREWIAAPIGFFVLIGMFLLVPMRENASPPWAWAAAYLALACVCFAGWLYVVHRRTPNQEDYANSKRQEAAEVIFQRAYGITRQLWTYFSDPINDAEHTDAHLADMYNRWRRDPVLFPAFGELMDEKDWPKPDRKLDADSLALFREAVLAPAPSQEVLQRVADEGGR